MLQAALAAGTAAPALGLRAVPAPAARGPPVRRGGRRRPGARRDRAASASTTRRSTCSRARRRRRADAASGWPTTASPATSGATPRARPTSPTRRCWSSRSTFAEAVLLETLLLSIYNHDSAIASAASRMTWAAGDRPCIEMGSRRTHEEAAVAAARAAYVAGFATTSNLAARQRYGVPTRRHQRAQLHAAARHRGATRSARRSTSLGTGTTLLVDTYDVAEAVRLGVEVAGTGARRGPARLRRPRRARPAGARPARRARRDRAPGSSSPATSTSTRSPRSPRRRSTATASAPQLVTGSGHPTCGFVYKLVAREGDDGAMVVGGQEEQGQDLDRRPQVRPAPARRRRASPRPRWSASASRPSTTATTGRCWCRWCATARSSAARPLDDARDAAPRGPRASCRWRRSRCPAASRSSRPSPRGRC